MKDVTFLRSFRLVPEIKKPFLLSSLIALAGTLIRMIGPQLISRGIDNFSISSSCSMLHVPYSLENEDGLDINLKNILSFAEEKLDELKVLNSSLTNNNDLSEISEYEGKRLVADKALVGRVVEDVRRRVSDLTDDDFIRSEDREMRLEKQSKA